MKLTIKETVEREIDIEFPYFVQDEIHTYCFISEIECIGIRNGEYTKAAIEHYRIYPKSWLLFPPCTQEEFQKHYENAQAEISQQYYELFSKNDLS